MTDNRREHLRYKIAVAAEIDGEPSGETRDISNGGVSVRTERALAQGTTALLTLMLTQDGIEDPDEEPFESKASVVWVQPDPQARRYTAGLQFATLSPQQNAQLQRFLQRLSQD